MTAWVTQRWFLSLAFPLRSVTALDGVHNIYPSAWASFESQVYFKLRRVSWISFWDFDALVEDNDSHVITELISALEI